MAVAAVSRRYFNLEDSLNNGLRNTVFTTLLRAGALQLSRPGFRRHLHVIKGKSLANLQLPSMLPSSVQGGHWPTIAFNAGVRKVDWPDAY